MFADSEIDCQRKADNAASRASQMADHPEKMKALSLLAIAYSTMAAQRSAR